MARRILVAIALLSFVLAPSSTATAQDLGPSMGMGSYLSILAHPDLGRILTDANGRTLYTWAADSPRISTCFDACASFWPPYEIAEARATILDDPGARDESMRDASFRLGVILRNNATYQITLDGRPLYFFQGDGAPGDAFGEGSDGFGARWSVIGVDDTMTIM